MLGVGIIGCGKIAQVRHLPEYHANPDCRIVALASMQAVFACIRSAAQGMPVLVETID